MLNETQLWAIFDGTIVTLEIAIVAIIFGAIFGVVVAVTKGIGFVKKLLGKAS